MIMKLSKSYIQSRDIDWFGNIDGIYVHAASAGGELPDIVNDRKMLREVQLAVYELKDIYEENQIVFNEDVIRKRLRDNIERLAEHNIENIEYNEEDSYKDYISTFAAMARKGFISFDRVNAFDITDNRYNWVARPCDFPNSRKPALVLPQKRVYSCEAFMLVLGKSKVNFIELLR